MEFEFCCPNCNYIITDKNFKQDAKILAHLQTTFGEHKNEYMKVLREEIIVDLQEQHNLEIKSKIAQKELEIINQKQLEIDAFKEQITTLVGKIETNKLELKNNLTIQELEFNNQKQLEHTKLTEIINQQKMLLTNNDVELNNKLIQKELEQKKIQDEIKEQFLADIKILNHTIEELKIANATNKVIQNKTKGENFEQDVNAELLKVFEDDKISKITSQDKKADYLQEVMIDGKKIGKIVYEVKNAEWSNAWEKKLYEDMAKQESKYGILVATSFNKKYPGIPFKKSDDSSNIYLCDAESFIFVGQIIRTIIKIEAKLEAQREESNYDQKIREFNNWKEIHLPKFSKIFEDSCQRIQESEASITKKVDEIRISREKIYATWFKNVRSFLEDFAF